MSDGQVLYFDPLDYAVRVHTEPAPLRAIEPDEFITHHAAQLVRVAEDGGVPELAFPKDKRAIASITWKRLGLGAAADEGLHPLTDVADAHSDELLEVLSGVLDEDGQPREELDISMDGGSDLLVLDGLWVSGEYDEVEVGQELLEHVLRHHSSGCYAAVFAQDEEMQPGVPGVLAGRRFAQIKKKALFVLDLATKRPPLPGDPDA